jgi:hypothetical protein
LRRALRFHPTTTIATTTTTTTTTSATAATVIAPFGIAVYDALERLREPLELCRLALQRLVLRVERLHARGVQGLLLLRLRPLNIPETIPHHMLESPKALIPGPAFHDVLQAADLQLLLPHAPYCVAQLRQLPLLDLQLLLQLHLLVCVAAVADTALPRRNRRCPLLARVLQARQHSPVHRLHCRAPLKLVAGTVHVHGLRLAVVRLPLHLP